MWKLQSWIKLDLGISALDYVRGIKNNEFTVEEFISESLEHINQVDENEITRYEKTVYENTFEFPLYQIGNAFENEFKMGGYYANLEIESEKILKFLKKYEKELTFLAMKHVDKINSSK